MAVSKKAKTKSSARKTPAKTSVKKPTKTSVKKPSKASPKTVKKTTPKKDGRRNSPTKEAIAKSSIRQRNHITVEGVDFENPESIQSFYDQQGMLTEKEVAFCMEYLNNGMIAKKAYSIIYGKEHLPSCAVSASILLRKPKLKVFLRKELDNRAARLGISADYIAKKYLVWAEGFIGDFVEVKTIGKGALTRQVLFLKNNLEDLSPEQKSCIQSIEPTKEGQIKVTMINQKSALDSLSKLLGYTQDKLQVVAEVGITLKFDKQDEGA